jgi:hypothetical protein
VLGASISWALGQDSNWDLKNYHIYNAFAFLSGRFGWDINPAGRPSYYNPLVDVPYYVLALYILPRWPCLVAAFQGLPFGLLVYFCLATNIRVFRQRTVLPTLTAALATVIGITGAATIPQVGTTFNEIQVAAAVLAGIWVMLPAGISGDSESRAAGIEGGLLFGIAAALKPTAARPRGGDRPLPSINLVRMNPETRRQLRHRRVPAQRAQGHLGLESRIVLASTC